MTNQQKTILFWIGAVFGIVLTVFLLVTINQQLNTATTTNTVSFSGMGKVTAKPNVAVTDFAIVTIGATSKDAQDKNATKSKAVTDFLAKQGVEDKDVKTSGYNIYPNYSYPRPVACPVGSQCPDYVDSAPKITGYSVNQNYQVKIRDFDKASVIVDGLVKAGVNQVNNLSFQIENPEALKAEARKKAITDAKQKADELKSQIGVSLGKIVNFQENVSGYPSPMMYDKVLTAGMGGGGEGSGPSLPTGENEVSVTVSITYQIK